MVFMSLGPFQVLQAQQVGIGTEEPTETLDINGSIRIRAGA